MLVNQGYKSAFPPNEASQGVSQEETSLEQICRPPAPTPSSAFPNWLAFFSSAIHSTNRMFAGGRGLLLAGVFLSTLIVALEVSLAGRCEIAQRIFFDFFCQAMATFVLCVWVLLFKLEFLLAFFGRAKPAIPQHFGNNNQANNIKKNRKPQILIQETPVKQIEPKTTPKIPPTETNFALSGETALIQNLSIQFRKKFSDVFSDQPHEEVELDIECEHNKFQKTFRRIRPISVGDSSIFLALHRFEHKLYAIQRVFVPCFHVSNFKKTKLYRRVVELSKLEHSSIGQYVTSWVESCHESSFSSPTSFSKRRARAASEAPSANREIIDNFSSQVFRKPEEVLREKDTHPRKNMTLQNFDNMYLYVQMEYCGANSIQRIMGVPSLEEHDRLIIFKKMLNGIDFIHSREISHGNISLNSVFMKEEDVKLAAFNLTSSDSFETTETFKSEEMLLEGDLRLAQRKSPKENKKTNFSNDIFSLGFVLFQLASGISDPAKAEEALKTLRNSHHKQGRNTLSHEMQLIMELTETEVKLRPSADVITSLPSYINWSEQVFRSVKDGDLQASL